MWVKDFVAENTTTPNKKGLNRKQGDVDSEENERDRPSENEEERGEPASATTTCRL